MCEYNIIYIYKSYGLAFPSRRTERKEVTVRFKSAVTFGKFLASPICYENRCYFRFYTSIALWIARVTVKNFDRVKAEKI